MLEIKNLHATVDEREILRGIDLTVGKGEIHAIMGPNGGGKSTLAYVLAGHPDYDGDRRLGDLQRARTCSRWSRTSAPPPASSSPSSIRSRSPASPP